MNPLIFPIRGMLSATGRGKLSILIYHRVRAEVDELFPGDVDCARFDEQMSWVASMLRPLSLRDAIGLLRERRLPARAVCVTFDDGYADNATRALPILRKHGIPATFFVASAYLDGGRMWNDTVIEAVRGAPMGSLRLEEIGLGDFPIGSPQSRRYAIDRILAQLKYLAPATRLARADAIAASVGASLPNDLMMRSDQVRELHRAGMSIGAHTATHPILMQLDPAAAREEIRAGRAALETIIGAQVDLFAYPNGKPGDDYDASHVAIVRDLGFTAAFSTSRGVADAESDLFQLPRSTPWARTFLRFAVGLARNNLERG